MYRVYRDITPRWERKPLLSPQLLSSLRAGIWFQFLSLVFFLKPSTNQLIDMYIYCSFFFISILLNYHYRIQKIVARPGKKIGSTFFLFTDLKSYGMGESLPDLAFAVCKKKLQIFIQNYTFLQQYLQIFFGESQFYPQVNYLYFVKKSFLLSPIFC